MKVKGNYMKIILDAIDEMEIEGVTVLQANVHHQMGCGIEKNERCDCEPKVQIARKIK